MQTCKYSIAEAVLNMLVGAVIVWLITQQMSYTLILTVLSVVRMYAIRRIFAKITKRGIYK